MIIEPIRLVFRSHAQATEYRQALIRAAVGRRAGITVLAPSGSQQAFERVVSRLLKVGVVEQVGRCLLVERRQKWEG